MLRLSARNLVLGLSLALSACGGCDAGDKHKEGQRLWGKGRLEADLEAKAKEPIDPYLLGERPELKNRVLAMSFDEVVARIGFLEYRGVASFHLSRHGHNMRIHEDTLLEHGLHGSYRVLQKDEDGAVTREIVQNNGVVYVRNGAGKLRVQGAMDAAHEGSRDEAFQPLRVYTSYFGPRVGLKKVGPAQVEGRAAAKYQFVLLDGTPLITVPGMRGAKRPISIGGTLLVDEATGAPIGADFTASLEIPGKDSETEPGKLDLSLKYSIKTVAGQEVKPGEFVPTIAAHPVDLDPLAFLDGGTRTSTVIGGKGASKPRIPAEVPEDEE